MGQAFRPVPRANDRPDGGRIGGLEYRVWSDELGGVVRKVTYGGNFGRTVRSVLRGWVPDESFAVFRSLVTCSLPVIASRTAGCAEDLVPASEQVAGGEWRVAGKETTDGEDVAATKQADARAARPYLEQRSNGLIFDPSSVDALSEALARVADYGTTGLKDDGTNTLAEMGQWSREIVAKFSCENFAWQALIAARAAQLA
ncbi:MAG: hypothetical protein JHC85_08660 [Chthoniobacterales bacterium]|jgi:glycosyltransferase involved in cell wall biosynthesis|nr:hypothetical protein [Chthoniobacterales bacterium]